jgi:hypothetical protein
VPLERLRLGPGAGAPDEPRMGVLASDGDVARLVEILDALEGGVVTLSGPLVGDILDSCRLGTRRCVEYQDTGGAAGAVLDPSGGVRPCAHGQPIARADDSFEQLLRRQRELIAAAEAERGCAECVARDHCSRCLFPGPLAGRYCDFMRGNATRLPLLHRLIDTLRHLAMHPSMGPTLRLKRRRTVPLIAARGRPFPVGEDAGDWVQEQLVKGLAERWRECETWLAANADRFVLFWKKDARLYSAPLDPAVAAIGELIADGATGRELADYARAYQLDEMTPARAYRQLFDLWQ